MYTPKINLLEDQTEITNFIKRFSFGAMITSENNIPSATHLPFIIEKEGDQIVLFSHMAKANNQWKDIENKKVLIVFSEPHAYISPSNYTKKETVPTWDYISIHVYGRIKLTNDYTSQIAILEKMIHQFDQGYKSQWEHISEDYKQSLAKELIAFQFVPYDIQGKKKLSQNKSGKERQNISDSLIKGASKSGQLLAEYMKDEN